MLKWINDLLSGLLATITGGVFLVVSFVLMLMEIKMAIDPAWVSIIICGIPLVYLSIWRLGNNPGMKKISSALLISIAMIAAICIGDIFAAGEVAFIMAIGAILEDRTAERAKKGLYDLISLAPQQGRWIQDGREEMIGIDEICVDYILRILPGETIPVDGEIINGSTSIDQSIMTGEFLPVDKEVGDSVFCGTINRFGAIDIMATKVGSDTSLQKLIRLIEDAESNKAPIERIADIFATWLVPIALLIAIISGFITNDIVRAVTILVVFCPCALVLATPTAVMAAIGQATKYGVIIKSGDVLERMGRVDILAFDKTGTLTSGELVVSDIHTFNENVSKEELLSLCASAESYSEHPLAKTIVAYSMECGLETRQVNSFLMTPGKGISAEVGGKILICGNSDFICENNISINESAIDVLNRFQNQGKATILIADNNQLLGVIALSDTIRTTSKETIRELKKTRTDVILLTGDNIQTAQYFAQKLGILDVHAGLLPSQKVEEIRKLQMQGHSVCMIGDGVNDAPALKTANVGVVMGTMGSDIAVDAADIALMGDDISRISYLKRLSSAAVKTIKLSIILSLCINFIAITLSIMGILTPTTGALVHNAGSIFVVLIAALLYDRKFITDDNHKG